MRTALLFTFCLLAFPALLLAQQPPYDSPPTVEAPYYRVRYEASQKAGELVYPVAYTVWIPPTSETLRGVIVHQHGCGEGSCKSGQTGAFDLHWQALAAKHDCALLAPSYEQPEGTDCQMWCDPRNGSDATFRRALVDLGEQAGHPELADAPWALWGHSGGGHWAGGMLMQHPERVAAAWLRSGVPLLEAAESGNIQPHELPLAALKVPVMCNLGTKEGVTVTDGRFSGVWPKNVAFLDAMRAQGALIGVAVDPRTSHECGNQRYLAIPWFDACLTARLANKPGDALRPMNEQEAWLAPRYAGQSEVVPPVPAEKFTGDVAQSVWLPNQRVAEAWVQYVTDTNVVDTTPPPAPTNVRREGNQLVWDAQADLESGLAYFVVERDGKQIAQVPEQPKNPFGRPLFQGLQYSDTPTLPLTPMRYTLKNDAEEATAYTVRSVNTAGLVSE